MSKEIYFHLGCGLAGIVLPPVYVGLSLASLGAGVKREYLPSNNRVRSSIDGFHIGIIGGAIVDPLFIFTAVMLNSYCNDPNILAVEIFLSLISYTVLSGITGLPVAQSCNILSDESQWSFKHIAWQTILGQILLLSATFMVGGCLSIFSTGCAKLLAYCCDLNHSTSSSVDTTTRTTKAKNVKPPISKKAITPENSQKKGEEEINLIQESGNIMLFQINKSAPGLEGVVEDKNDNDPRLNL